MTFSWGVKTKIWKKYGAWLLLPLLLSFFIVFLIVNLLGGGRDNNNVVNNTKLGAETKAQPNAQSNVYKLSADEAIAKVEDLDDVKRWKALFTDNGRSPQTGGISVISIWNETPEAFEVEAYESMEDRNVNFGFYRVDKSNGQVYEMKKY